MRITIKRFENGSKEDRRGTLSCRFYSCTFLKPLNDNCFHGLVVLFYSTLTWKGIVFLAVFAPHLPMAWPGSMRRGWKVSYHISSLHALKLLTRFSSNLLKKHFFWCLCCCLNSFFPYLSVEMSAILICVCTTCFNVIHKMLEENRDPESNIV